MSPEVCFIVGARPNFMKAAPVYQALAEQDGAPDLLLVHTGQHYDAEMSDVFLEELGLPVPDVSLGAGSGTHAEQTARALLGIEKILLDRRPALVVVAGDVNSTLAGALAAVKLGIPVAHIESGLRSFDPTMPEEHNRRLTDHVSTVLLVHSQSGVDNLQREGIRDGVELVGNTMIDSLLRHVDAARARRPWESLDLEPGSYALRHAPSTGARRRRRRACAPSPTAWPRSSKRCRSCFPRTPVRAVGWMRSISAPCSRPPASSSSLRSATSTSWVSKRPPGWWSPIRAAFRRRPRPSAFRVSRFGTRRSGQ